LRAVHAAVAAGLLLRLAFGLGYWTGKPLTQDEREYLTLAANVAHGRGFASNKDKLLDMPCRLCHTGAP